MAGQNMQEPKPLSDSLPPSFSDWMMPPEEESAVLRGTKNSGRFRRFFKPVMHSPGIFFESTLIMLLALGVSYLCAPHDPLLLTLEFPFAWIVPIILALQYGSLIGIYSGLLLLTSWFLFYSGIDPHVLLMDPLSLFLIMKASPPPVFFLGGLLLVLITGQYDDVWSGRLSHANAMNNYLNERLSVLTHNHFLLRLSHDRLEKDFLVKPTTLRDTLLQLRQIAINQVESKETLPGVDELLHLVAQACQLEAAAVYKVNGGKISEQAEAQVGLPFQINRNDLLLRLCIEKKTLMHLQTPELQQGGHSEYIACVPFVTSTDQLFGVLLVQSMPFLSLNYENLQLLRVLTGYYTDGVHHAEIVQKVLQTIPYCPAEFALDYMRLIRLQREAHIESCILGLRFGPHEMQDVLSSYVAHNVRALDVAWTARSGQHVVLMILVPLSGNNTIMGYLLRIEESIKRLFGLTFNQAQIFVQSVKINSPLDEQIMMNLLAKMNVDG